MHKLQHVLRILVDPLCHYDMYEKRCVGDYVVICKTTKLSCSKGFHLFKHGHAGRIIELFLAVSKYM